MSLDPREALKNKKTSLTQSPSPRQADRGKEQQNLAFSAPDTLKNFPMPPGTLTSQCHLYPTYTLSFSRQMKGLSLYGIHIISKLP